MCAVTLMGIAACDDPPAEPDADGAGGATASSSSSSAGGAQVSAGGSGGAGAAPLECSGLPTSTVPVAECDLLQQNCPQGSGCEPVPAGSGFETQCVSSSGLKGAKASCSDHGECQAGLSCALGFCSPPCCPETNEPCDGGTCNTVLGFGDYIVNYCSYLVTCEIFTADACRAGQDCHILNGDGYAVCVDPATRVGEGEPCRFLNQCGAMQTCWPPGVAGSVCRYHCLLASPDAPVGLGGCPEQQSCGIVDVGIDGVGVCLPAD
jgi:hypothetical protein